MRRSRTRRARPNLRCCFVAYLEPAILGGRMVSPSSMLTPEQAMTRSTSSMKASRAWIILVALLLLTGVASAERRRVVILEFEGDKAEQFHADIIKLVKKS